MNQSRAGARLRILLGHLSQRSARVAVSFGLRGARAASVVASRAQRPAGSSPSSAPRPRDGQSCSGRPGRRGEGVGGQGAGAIQGILGACFPGLRGGVSVLTEGPALSYGGIFCTWPRVTRPPRARDMRSTVAPQTGAQSCLEQGVQAGEEAGRQASRRAGLQVGRQQCALAGHWPAPSGSSFLGESCVNPEEWMRSLLIGPSEVALRGNVWGPRAGSPRMSLRDTYITLLYRIGSPAPISVHFRGYF